MPWTAAANLPPIVRRIDAGGMTGCRASAGTPSACCLRVAPGVGSAGDNGEDPAAAFHESAAADRRAVEGRRHRERPELTARDDGAHERTMTRTGRWPELCEADAERRKAAVAPAGPRGLRWGPNRPIDGIDISTNGAGCATAPQGQVALP